MEHSYNIQHIQEIITSNSLYKKTVKNKQTKILNEKSQEQNDEKCVPSEIKYTIVSVDISKPILKNESDTTPDLNKIDEDNKNALLDITQIQQEYTFYKKELELVEDKLNNTSDNDEIRTYNVQILNLKNELVMLQDNMNYLIQSTQVFDTTKEIIECNENILDISKYQYFRSVILSESGDKLLSFSQPKSVSLQEFSDKYPIINDKKFILTEIIEGTMINLWWDPYNEKWEISTKKAVSGNYTYFKNPFREKTLTFKDMVMEIIGDYTQIGDRLNKSYNYSFVLQHPENHIVHYISKPSLYLVAVYEKVDEWIVKYIPQNVFSKWLCWSEFGIKFPTLYSEVDTNQPIFNNYGDINEYINLDNRKKSQIQPIFNHYGDIREYLNESFIVDNQKKSKIKHYNNITNEDTNYMMGIMITNSETGERTKIENETYLYLKELRGNHPSHKYKYYELIYSHRLDEFIYYFPQYVYLFNQFSFELNTFVNNIYWYYVNKFILKNKKIEGIIPYNINYHINKLHYNVYLYQLNMGNRSKITIKVIYDYIWKLPIRSLLFWLNYESIMAKKNSKNIQN